MQWCANYIRDFQGADDYYPRPAKPMVPQGWSPPPFPSYKVNIDGEFNIFRFNVVSPSIFL